MLQASEIQKRFTHLEKIIEKASAACHADTKLPKDLLDCVDQLDKQSEMAKKIIESKDENRLLQWVEDLEQVGDRAEKACQHATDVDASVQSAVTSIHAELSDLKKQLHTPVSPEQVAAAQKVNLDTFCGLTNKIVEGVEKLAELNLQVIKTTLAEAQDSAGKALSARDPREWFALQLSFTAPIAEKMHAYGRHLFDISSATQAEFARVAQAQHEVHNRWVQTLVEDLAKSAPVGSEAAIAAWQSVINTTNTLYETLQKTGQEAVTVAERDFDDATSAASTAVRRTIDQASGA